MFKNARFLNTSISYSREVLIGVGFVVAPGFLDCRQRRLVHLDGGPGGLGSLCLVVLALAAALDNPVSRLDPVVSVSSQRSLALGFICPVLFYLTPIHRRDERRGVVKG